MTIDSKILNESVADLQKVFIVLATYNPDIVFFREQIHSIKNQTFKNWKCIITDDGSREDLFVNLCDAIGEDTRFSVFKNTKNAGSVYNFENGLRIADADPQCGFIAFCDQDDIWVEDKLEKIMEAFVDPNIVLVHSDLEVIDAMGNTLYNSCWQMEGRQVNDIGFDELIFRNSVTGCACLFKKSILPLAMPFFLNIRRSYHHDVWVALLSLKLGKIKPLTLPLVRYRQHANNQVGGADLKSRSIKRYFNFLLRPSVPIAKCIDAYLFRRRLAEDFYLRAQTKTLF